MCQAEPQKIERPGRSTQNTDGSKQEHDELKENLHQIDSEMQSTCLENMRRLGPTFPTKILHEP